MKTFFFLLLLPLSSWAMAPLHFIEVEGSINPGSSSYIVESIRAAEKAGSQGLILRLNTPGGLLSSTRDIIQGISASRVPVIVYVGPGGASATSAGALLALSSHIVVMAPGATIGAAHPVGPGGEEVKGPMGEKVTNDTAALARAQATLRGRNPEVAEKIVTKSASFSAEEAEKAKIIDFVASDLENLLQKIHGKTIPSISSILDTKTLSINSLVRLPMNLRQKFLHLVADPNISALLLTLGGVAVYVEISSGFAYLVPGALGLFCLLLGFISLQTIPINIGGALLFALGFALLAAEAFVTSYGLLTVAALATIFLGGLFLVDPTTTDMRVSLSFLIPLVASIGAILGFVTYLLYRDRRAGSPATSDIVVGQLAKIARVDAGGQSGSAYANGELWQFYSEETFAEGEEATVHSLQGMRIQLKRRK